ncbi:type II toxin-antitoxin system PemK/MazF family toxin [Stieleria tagensis]|uniref:type II toxin-antitoxin system PemK/MazF family toxin n=1 Tax=Stieleria tagensis TaxID=2956795 RepID=UPI0036F2FCDC
MPEKDAAIGKGRLSTRCSRGARIASVGSVQTTQRQIAEVEVARGDVVWVKLLDPQGGNEKIRPAVVVDLTENGEVCIVVAGTTKFNDTDLLRPDVIQLPYSTSSDTPSRTGLRCKTAVICTWFERIPVDEIQDRTGNVPTVLYNAILRRVKENYQSKKASGDT